MTDNRAYRRKEKKKKQQSNPKVETNAKIKAYILLAALAIVVSLLGFCILVPGFFTGGVTSKMPVENEVLDPTMVCMVNNSYKSSEMIPVSIGDRLYYDCCVSCEKKLKNRSDLYYANDPLTGEKVDKATAVITYDPVRYPAVLYFGSLHNAEEFLGAELEKDTKTLNE